MAEEVERKRILKPEPVLILSLKKRKTLIPRGPLREATLDFLEDVSRRLRNRESWVEDTASITRSMIIQTLIARVLAILGIRV